MKYFFYVLSLLLLISASANAQWTQFSNGLFGGYTNLIYASGSDVYSVSYHNGVYYSSDNGISWIHRNTGITDPNIHSLYNNGTYLYAGTNSQKIFRSSNKGISWEQSGSGISNCIINVITSQANILYAGTDVNGVYKSIDNGNSWFQSGSGLPYSEVKDILVTGEFTADPVFAATNNGIYRSTNMGQSWSFISFGIPTTANIKSMAKTGNTIFAATYYGFGIYKSTNMGLSWTASNNGLPADIYISKVTVVNSDIYIATGDGIFKSTDSGNFWSQCNTGIYTGNSNWIAGNSSGLFASTSVGVFRSTTSGQSWVTANNGFMPDLAVKVFYKSGNTIFAGTDGNGVFKSTDNGLNWISCSTGMKNLIVESFSEINGEIYASTINGIFKTSNMGEVWTTAYPTKLIYSLTVKDNFIFAGICSCSGGGIIRSSDNGNSWVMVIAGLENTNVSAMATKGNMVFAGSNDGIYKSTDNGDRWEKKTDGMPSDPYLSCITVKGDSIVLGTSGLGAYISVDEGESWTQFGTGIPNETIINKIDFYQGGFFASTPIGIYYKAHTVNNWVMINDGLPIPDISGLKVFGDEIFAGAGLMAHNGIWKRSAAQIVGVKTISSEIPADFSLEQNYPNPFNSSSNVKFQIINSGVVKIMVYDLSGREISTLVNEYKQPGSYEIKFDAKNFSSGIYFYRLESNNVKIARKFIILK